MIHYISRISGEKNDHINGCRTEAYEKIPYLLMIKVLNNLKIKLNFFPCDKSETLALWFVLLFRVLSHVWLFATLGCSSTWASVLYCLLNFLSSLSIQSMTLSNHLILLLLSPPALNLFDTKIKRMRTSAPSFLNTTWGWKSELVL